MASTRKTKSSESEQAVKAERQRLYELFMHAPAAIAVVSGPKLIFELANDPFRQLVGKDRKIDGLPVLEAVPDIEPGLLKIIKNVAFKGQRFEASELPVLLDWNRDGQPYTKYLNFVYEPLYNEHKKPDGLMYFAYDVSEQVKTRQKIEESEARYRSLFNTIDQGFCVIEVLLDKADKPNDYRFLEANIMFEQQTGLKDPVGRTIRQLAPKIEKHWFEWYGTVAKTGKAVRFTDYSKALGKWFDVHASKIGSKKSRRVAILFTDITKRVEAEEALKQTQESLTVAVEAAQMGTWDYEFATDTVRRNLRHDQIFGYSELQKKWGVKIAKKHMVPEDRKTFDTSMANALKTGKLEFEVRVCYPDNSVHWVRCIGKVHYDANKNPVRMAGVLFEITERKQAQDALQKQLQVTETITNNSSSSLFMIDQCGLVTYMNPAASQVTGYTMAETIGQPMHQLVHHSRPDGSPFPESECPLVETYKHAVPNPAHEDIFFRKDGSPFPAMIIGTPIPSESGIRTTMVEFRDITQEKQAIETLAKSEERLRFMAESMPQKVFSATADGNVDYMNEEWVKFTGLSFKQIKNWGWTQFIHPDDVDENVRRWQHSIDTGEPFQLEHRFKHHDGEYHLHLSRARAMRDENGTIVRWYGSNTDVEEIKNTIEQRDELKEITAALREQRAELVALNEAKDEFISLASHQLRTPASAVKQFLGMMLEGYVGELPQQQRSLLEQARDSNERQIMIVNDLLKVALLDAGKVRLNKQPVDLVALINEVITEQAAKFQKRRQKVVFTHKQKSLKSRIDSDRTRMVLENLIDNASKYTHANKQIEVDVFKANGRVMIVVKDQGVGIEKKDLDKLFLKFSRLDNPLSVLVGGTGLGLYWAKKIIDLHGGSIDVVSTPRKGSEFTISLPTS